MATPASIAESERLVSIAGVGVNEDRPMTKQELVEAVQCLRSFFTQEIV